MRNTRLSWLIVIIAILLECGAAFSQGTIDNGGIVTGSITDGQTAVWNFPGAMTGQFICASVNPTSVNPNFAPAVGFQSDSLFGEGDVGARNCTHITGAAPTQIFVENAHTYDPKHPMTYSYTLEVATPNPPFDPSNGGQVAASGAVYNGMTVGHNVDIWRFSARAADIVQITVYHQNTGGLGGYSPWIYITYPDGTTFKAFESGSNGVQTMPFSVSETGTYIVYVYNETQINDNSYNYTFSVNGTSLSISPVQLTVAPGQNYTYDLQATGGSGKYSWSVLSGFPAQWFSFNSSGQIASLTQLYTEYRGAPEKNVPLIPDPGTYNFTVVASDGSTTANGSVTMIVSCGDADQDNLIKQYKVAGTTKKALGIVPFPVAPACSAMTNSASTTRFTFSQLTVDNDDDWALLRQPLLEPPSGYPDENPCPLPPTPPAAYSPSSPICPPSGTYGLDAWVAAYLADNALSAPRVINSGYRTPEHNAKIKGVAGSRHVLGDATDLKNITDTQDEWNAMKMAAQKAHASWIERLSGPCKLGCVHADWRWVPGEYSK